MQTEKKQIASQKKFSCSDKLTAWIKEFTLKVPRNRTIDGKPNIKSWQREKKIL